MASKWTEAKLPIKMWACVDRAGKVNLVLFRKKDAAFACENGERIEPVLVVPREVDNER